MVGRELAFDWLADSCELQFSPLVDQLLTHGQLTGHVIDPVDLRPLDWSDATDSGDESDASSSVCFINSLQAVCGGGGARGGLEGARVGLEEAGGGDEGSSSNQQSPSRYTDTSQSRSIVVLIF